MAYISADVVLIPDEAGSPPEFKRAAAEQA
jgi:hypothetical protein